MANIKDVARAAGLSVGTVSRVLNNRGYISKETRAKVMDAMRQLNYVPNELAKSIFRKYTNIIGLLVPSVTHPYFSKIVEAVEQHAFDLGYKILLCNSYFDERKEIEYFKMLKSNKVDGIILGSRNLEIDDSLTGGLPLVSIDRILREDIACIVSDNYQGGKLATEHLLSKGCRKIACLGGWPSLHLMANQRIDAFRDVCKREQLDPIVISTNETQFSEMSYYADIERLFEQYPDIEGIFATSDIMAAQVIQVAFGKGIRVPDQVKVVGYDDTNIASLTTPTITTIQQPADAISKYALELLIQQIKGNIVPLRTILPVKLIERASA